MLQAHAACTLADLDMPPLGLDADSQGTCRRLEYSDIQPLGLDANFLGTCPMLENLV